MNLPLFRRTFAANAVKLVVIAAGLALMGALMPVVYSAFGQEMSKLMASMPMFNQVAQFGGGDIFSLVGSIALGFSHPFTLLLVGVMAVAYPALAIAGERDKGTLEVLLSRPISRHGLYVTLFVAGVLFILGLLAVMVVSATVATLAVGLGHELEPANLVALWLVASLLFVAFMSLAFAVSVGSDRAAPALGIPAVFVLLNYLALAIGSIWPDASWLQDWSMFNLLKAQDILRSGPAPADVAILLAFTAVFVAVAWWRFPRRDLPAPG